MKAYRPLSEIVKELEVKPGEVIYLATDLTKLAYTAKKNSKAFDPFLLLSYFQNALTKEGTLLIPTFNHHLKKNETFDILNTKPVTGTLPEHALKAPEFIRTYNALHSFAVWGKDATYLSKLRNESSFSAESPFGYLLKNKARMLTIDLDLQSSLTFTHFTEECENVNYRSWKNISINYINEHGKEEKTNFKLFAKKRGYINNVNPITQSLKEKGGLSHKTFNGVDLLSVKLDIAHEVIAKDIRENKSKNIVFFSAKSWMKSIVKSAIGKA